MKVLAIIGQIVLGALATAGRIVIFTTNSLRHCVLPPYYLRLTGRQMVAIGYFSLPEAGATTLSITHDMASARKIADRIAMLHKGKIVWAGPVDQVDDSGNPFVDQFINGRTEGPIQMEVLKT